MRASVVLLATLLALLAGFWVARVAGASSGGAAYGFRATGFAAVAAGFCVAHGWAWRGARFIATFAGIAMATSAITEIIGLRTGVIFGHYAYSAEFPAKILGLPAVIPVIWFSISYLSFATAAAIRREPKGSHARIAAALLLSYDLVADPNHLFRGGWSYTPAGFFHGVPLQNFIAWYVIGWAMFWVLDRLRGLDAPTSPAPTRLISLAWVGYLAILVHEIAFAAFVSRLPILAASGLVLVVSCVWGLVRGSRAQGQTPPRENVVAQPLDSRAAQGYR